MIGYYVHHHGRGHLGRATALAGATDEPVVALSSLLEPPRPHPFAGWVGLSPDPAMPDAADPDAGGVLHWAPTNSAGYAARMAQLATWVAQARPRVVVVDVSVEVALAVRLAGTPVAVVTLPGDRDDPAHEAAHRIASVIVAPWPAALLRPERLARFAGRTVATGAISRFDGHDVRVSPRCEGCEVVVLHGAGGTDVSTAQLAAAQRACPPGVRWTVVGGNGRWVDDVWTLLGRADVVVTHAGLNALAEVAAARRPAVVIPAERPFAEQRRTAEALQRAGLATVLPSWPGAERWPSVLADARGRGGDGWQAWNDGQGARRFADALRCPEPAR